MSGGSDIYKLREWMYTRKDSSGAVTKEFYDGLEIFMYQATNMPMTRATGKMHCPCRKYMNNRYIRSELVGSHLYNRGFMPHYFLWIQHGEGHGQNLACSSNSNYQPADNHDPDILQEHHQYDYDHDMDVGHHQDHNRFHDMVNHAFIETTASFTENTVEAPNLDARQFYDMLDAANQPIYDGCREGLSKLSLASRMMNIKTDHNLSEICMDSWAELIKEYLPEDNVSAESYYEIQKLVFSLGLPSEMIDVCINNCMIFWKDDDKLQECRFCQKPRYKPQGT